MSPLLLMFDFKKLEFDLPAFDSDRGREKLGERLYHLRKVLSARGLSRGMHCELSKADINAGDGYLGIRDRAEGHSREHIRSCIKVLCFCSASFAHGLEHRGGDGIGRISLV